MFYAIGQRYAVIIYCTSIYFSFLSKKSAAAW